MFPFWNSNPPGRIPVVTGVLILLNFIVFLATWRHIDATATSWGFVNANGLGSFHAWATLISATFLHLDWLHILGNMWFLWIFGPRVEGAVGTWFLPLYIVGGAIAAIGSMLLAPHAGAGIGASGAISFIIGMYWIMFPEDKIWSLNPMFTNNGAGGGDNRYIVELSVWFAIILWFALQLIPAFMSALAGLPDADGVGYSAHIVGVVGGFFIGRYWKKKIDNQIARIDTDLHKAI